MGHGPDESLLSFAAVALVAPMTFPLIAVLVLDAGPAEAVLLAAAGAPLALG